MKNDYEIVKTLKAGDKTKQEFFLQKIRASLKKYSYQVEDEKLEQLFMKAVNDYSEDSNNMFYFYALNYIKSNLENNETITKNELFSELETLIIKKYLSTKNNEFLQTDEIAKELGEEITTVTQTIYKFKQYMNLQPIVIQNIFGFVTPIVAAREKNAIRPPRQQILLAEEDLELLGSYTGQIDDICMDITDLAKKYNKLPKIIEFKLKDIFTLLKKNVSIKNQILTKYPEIEPMLKIKEKALVSKANTKTPQKKVIHKKVMPKEKVSATEINLLTQLYMKKEDGSFYTYKEIAKIMGINYTNFINRKNRLLKKLEENPSFKSQILEIMPNLSTLQEEYNQGTDSEVAPTPLVAQKKEEKKLTKTMQKNIKFLSQLYSKKEDGTFYTYKESAQQLGMSYQGFIMKKKRLLKALEDQTEFKNLILKYIPNLTALQEEYNQSNTTQKDDSLPVAENKSEKKIPKRTQKNIEFLTQLYSKKEDGTLYTYKEIAQQLGMSYQAFITKKNKLLKALEDQAEFKNLMLEYIPNLTALQEEHNQSNTTQKNDSLPVAENKNEKKLPKRLQKNIEFLTQLYSKKEDGTFYTYKETAQQLSMTYQAFITKKNKLLKALEDQEEFKSLILEHIPNLTAIQEEQKTKDKEKKPTTNPIHLELSPKEQELLSLYEDTTEKVVPKHVLAAKLKITPATFSWLKTATIKKVTNNPLLVAQYQQPVENIIIKDNFRKTNSISISEEELERMKQAARYYDIPHAPQKSSSKDKLWKGIKALEESTYKDYASLCTTEQKAMLALRLGFFNESIFSSSDVANFFHTTKEEVSLLTTECLKAAVPELQKANIKQKK